MCSFGTPLSEDTNSLGNGQIAEVGEVTAKQCHIDDLERIIGSIHGMKLSLQCQVYARELCKAMLPQIALELRGGAGGCAPAVGSACSDGELT